MGLLIYSGQFAFYNTSNSLPARMAGFLHNLGGNLHERQAGI